MSDNNSPFEGQRLPEQLNKKCSECRKPLTDVEEKTNARSMCSRCFAKQRCVPRGEATEYPLSGPPAFPRCQPAKKKMPNCQKCNKQPRQPHAVYCCGAMYCEYCLLMIMSDAQQKGEQPMCINPTCQKPMGEKPQVKTKRGQQVAEDTRPIASQREGTPRLDSAEPQPEIARVMNQSGPALFNQMGQPLTATVLRPQRAGAAPIPTFVSNVTGQIVQPAQYSRALFHAGATAEPVSAGLGIQGPNETSTTTMMAPNSAESCPSIAIASAGTQSSNGRVPKPTRVVTYTNTATSFPVQQGRQHMPYSLSLFRQEARAPPVLSRLRREDTSELSIGEPQPKRARVPNPEYPNPPPDAVYDIPLCPLCQDNVNDPIEMKKCCRRLFCRKCIVEDLKLLPLCPSCNAEYSLGEVADLINSFSDSLSEQVDETLSQTLQKNNSNFDVKAYCKQFGDYNEVQLSEMLKELHKALKEKRENREKSSRRTELSSVLYLALDDYHQKTEQKIEKNRRQIEQIVRVKQFINGEAGSSRQDSSPSTSAANRADQPNRRRHEAFLATSPSARLTYSRVKRHFNAFSKCFKEISNRYGTNTAEESQVIRNKRINDLLVFTNGITRYGNICRNGILHYPICRETSLPVISSLDFDSTGRRFLVTGSTRKIKIFDYQELFDSLIKHHEHTTLCQQPTVLQWKDKNDKDITVSCAAWSPSEENTLVSGGHGGEVAVWDANTNSIVRTFDGSTGRCYAIKFNNEDPELVASANYDGKLKLWNIKCGYLDQILNRSCIYCVDFSPTDKNYLVFGSGDRGVHLYDIRQVNNPVAKLEGHTGSVSHVRYINSNEVVSASLDGSLRVWNVTEQKCTKELRGHVNESNFVGLSGAGDYIICGSENNNAVVYFKDLSEPLGSYSMSSGTIPMDQYVSSVCWKKGTNYALVANSKGEIHLVEMS